MARHMQGITIGIKDELVSKPYVEMTIKLMEKFGVRVNQLDSLQKLQIPGKQSYKSPGRVFVEGDASSASYFLAGATITGGTIRVVGCGSESVQVCSCHCPYFAFKARARTRKLSLHKCMEFNTSW
jgi:3-phosphoshikimate 1-carboxyvinyltransferase